MDPADRLVRKAREYEILAASHAERAPLAGGDGAEDSKAAVAFTLAAIVLREVAEALDDQAEAA
jgi:hypothetical protein